MTKEQIIQEIKEICERTKAMTAQELFWVEGYELTPLFTALGRLVYDETVRIESVSRQR